MKSAYLISKIEGLDDRVTCAKTKEDDHRWIVKTPEWPRGRSWGCFNMRLGAELLYYNLALRNGLPMPKSDVLVIDAVGFLGRTVTNVQCWGTEFQEARFAIGKENELNADVARCVEQSLKNNPRALDAYLRAAFLDVMLLNGDRTVSNVLGLTGGSDAGIFLYYFDHEQSFGWKNCIEVYGKNRIMPPVEEWEVVNRYLVIERKYKWAQRFSDSDRRHRVFQALALEPEFLESLSSQVAPHWISSEQFNLIREGLVRWWEFLRCEQSYTKLDARLFG